MSKELALIDSEVAKVTDVEVNGLGSADLAKCMVHVGGFAVIDSGKVERATKSAIEQRGSYVNARKELKEALGKVDVKAKAFLPAKVWNEVCVRTGLIQMTPDYQNQIVVRVNPVSIQASITSTSVITMLALAVIAGGIGTYQASADGFWYMVLLGGGYFMAGLAAMAVMCFAAFVVLEKPVERLQLKLWTLFTPKRKQIAHFFNKAGGRHDSSMRTTLVLPTPPTSVVETLTKLVNFGIGTMRIAAVPEAINFSHTPYGLLLEDNNRRAAARDEERERIRAMQRDPIIYLEYNGCVAVIEQFGEFPIEIDTVKKVLQLEFIA